MTGNRVLGKPTRPAPPTPETAPSAGTIGKLQDVVARLQAIEKLNNNLQGQYMQGSAAWESCEKVDDQLHEIFTLLGE